jgi:hypothetical protein
MMSSFANYFLNLKILEARTLPLPNDAIFWITVEVVKDA